MSSQLIATDNHLYNSVQYWDKRYESVGRKSESESRQSSYDWLVSYSHLRHVIDKWVPKSASVLMLGCGNSLLSEQMFREGYHNIENIDYSEPVIRQMSTHCEHCSRMKWSVMNCLDLTFDDHSFDVVIEKATIDALLTEETDPWNISPKGRDQVHSALNEVCRVLRTGGQFISVSFYGSHFRYPLYKSCFDWRDSQPKLYMNDIQELGTHFHYYCYQLIKSMDQLTEFVPKVYELPKLVAAITGHGASNDKIDNTTEDGENDNYLFNISL